MWNAKRFLAASAAGAIAASSMFITAGAAPTTTDPKETMVNSNGKTALPSSLAAVVPAVANYQLAAGEDYIPNPNLRLLASATDLPKFSDTLNTLAAELNSELEGGQVSVAVGDITSANPGDIVFSTGEVAGSEQPERYSWKANKVLVVTAPQEAGVWAASRTLLQALRAAGKVDAGTVIDYPKYAWRSLMLDNGRKFFSAEWTVNLIKQLSYLKVNRLELHLSDGSGFRVQVDTHPEVLSKEYLTKADIAKIVAAAKQYHVEIIPEIDSPGHAEQILSQHPELQLRITNGEVSKGRLDYSKAEARQFMKDIIGEVAKMFPNSHYFGIGGDEFVPANWEWTFPEDYTKHLPTHERAPQLVNWAEAATGKTGLNLHDSYVVYLNELVEFLHTQGKTATVYNEAANQVDDSPRTDPPVNRGQIGISKDAVINVWAAGGHDNQAFLDYRDRGYRLVNGNGDKLYYILTKDGRRPNKQDKSPGGLYENWDTTTVMGPGSPVPQGDYLLGSRMSIWSDDPSHQTPAQVADEAGQWFYSFAQNAYGSPKIAESWEEFLPITQKVGLAPTMTSSWGSAPPPTRKIVPATSDSSGEPSRPVNPDEGIHAVIPTPQKLEFSPNEAPYLPISGGRIIVPAGNAQMREDAQLFAQYLQTITGFNYQVQETAANTGSILPKTGDIVLKQGDVVGVAQDKIAEAYELLSSAGVITLTASTADGMFWGMQTILQSLRSGGLVQAAKVTDWSAYPIRQLHVDAARKYFPASWFKQEIDRMASLKINQLQWHFSENEGFRLESKKHPDLMTQPFITQAEAKEIIAYAKARHVKVVPAFDMPGHLKAILDKRPELRAGESDVLRKMIDYSKPESVAFLKDLVAEFAPIFAPNSDTWMIGGDEVFDMGWIPNELAAKVPQLDAYAKRVVNPNATVMDGYMHFLNEMDKYVRELGFPQTRVWSDLLYTSEHQNLAGETQVAYWTQWHEKMPSTDVLVAKGHKLLNVSDAYFYYVLPACPTCAYNTHADAAKILAEYNPRKFPEKANKLVDPNYVLGSSYAIWCDDPNLKTPEFIGTDSLPMLAAMSQKTWNPDVAVADASKFVERVKINDSANSAKPVQQEVSTSHANGETVKPGEKFDYQIKFVNNSEKAVDFTALAELSEGATFTDLQLNVAPAEKVPGPNLALHRPVTTSGVEDPAWNGTWITDGVTSPADRKNNRWSSGYDDNSWAYVDLGEPKNISNIRITWEDACATRFKLQVSNDAQTWQDATEVQENLNCAKLLTTNSINAGTANSKWRYVKMQGIDRKVFGDRKWGMSLFEMEVFAPEQDRPKGDARIESDNVIIYDGPQILPGSTVTIQAKIAVSEQIAAKKIFLRTVMSDGKRRQKDLREFPLINNGISPEPAPQPDPGTGDTTATEVERLAGSDRYATALAVAKSHWNANNTKHIYLARGDIFIDALSGGSLQDGPLLLVSPNKVTADLLAYVRELGKPVVMLGGPGSISDALGQKVAQGASLSRLGGVDRVETALEIAKYAFPQGTKKVYVTSAFGPNNDGQAAPDALAAGSLKDGPILLVHNGKGYTASVLEFLKQAKVSEVTQLGGINLGIQGKYKPQTIVAGSDRCETAVKIARLHPEHPQQILLVNGWQLSDAVTALQLGKIPVLFTHSDTIPTSTQAYLKEIRPKKITVVGGPYSVSAKVLEKL